MSDMLRRVGTDLEAYRRILDEQARLLWKPAKYVRLDNVTTRANPDVAERGGVVNLEYTSRQNALYRDFQPPTAVQGADNDEWVQPHSNGLPDASDGKRYLEPIDVYAVFVEQAPPLTSYNVVQEEDWKPIARVLKHSVEDLGISPKIGDRIILLEPDGALYETLDVLDVRISGRWGQSTEHLFYDLDVSRPSAGS